MTTPKKSVAARSKPKSRVTYPAELRSRAKVYQAGLVTIAVQFPDGTKMEQQGTADVLGCQVAKWAMALLFADDVKNLPNLERTLKELLDAPINEERP
jgi:hypothetical protein